MQPRLTVRAFAEMLALPAYEQLRILNEQKNPQQQPQKFRVPFYLPALTGIRNFYRLGNDPAALLDARRRISGITQKSKRDSNVRVLDGFERSVQFTRPLILRPNATMEASIGKVRLKLQFDLRANEQSNVRSILYNFRVAPIDGDTARTSLELAHWVLEENGISGALGSLEYVDLSGGRTHRAKTRRAVTLRRAKQSAKVIETLWASL